MFAPKARSGDALSEMSVAIFNDETMKSRLSSRVYARFKEALVTGAPTSEDDQKAIAEAMFKWARELGAVSFAHWFFPMRGGSGAYGSMCGACKFDTLIDLDWSSSEATKPFLATLPPERLFQGETDGSSFPNGGLRATHTAAAFTTWDRSSPCFVMDKVLRIPCAFVTHLGACIDDKTPLLRSNDAVNKQGLRLLKNISIGTDAKAIHSFLGWEQEFFIVKADLYRKRPDLVNCGRTLIGKLPNRNQQAELNYFAPVPEVVEKLLNNVQAMCLKLGIPMAVLHNEARAIHPTSAGSRAIVMSLGSLVVAMLCEPVQSAMMGMGGPMAAIANAPAGPFYIHFWAPNFKWALSFNNILDYNRPTDSISLSMTSALTLTGAIFMRWSFVITPVNYSLFFVNFALFSSSGYHLGRKIKADYVDKN